MPIPGRVAPFFFLAALACGDSPTSSCEPPPWPFASTEWDDVARELLATAPPDSVITITIGNDPRSPALREWINATPNVTIVHEFQAFTGFEVSMPVRALADLVEVPGITWVDWGVGGGDCPLARSAWIKLRVAAQPPR